MRGLDKKQISKLRRERAMWLRIYGPSKLRPDEIRHDIQQIKTLNLGPLGSRAIANVYEREGQHEKSVEMLRAARYTSRKSLVIAILLLVLLVIGGFVGLILAIIFFVESAASLATASSTGCLLRR